MDAVTPKLLIPTHTDCFCSIYRGNAGVEVDTKVVAVDTKPTRCLYGHEAARIFTLAEPRIPPAPKLSYPERETIAVQKCMLLICAEMNNITVHNKITPAQLCFMTKLQKNTAPNPD
jgi:hypothetical protein